MGVVWPGPSCGLYNKCSLAAWQLGSLVARQLGCFKIWPYNSRSLTAWQRSFTTSAVWQLDSLAMWFYNSLLLGCVAGWIILEQDLEWSRVRYGRHCALWVRLLWRHLEKPMNPNCFFKNSWTQAPAADLTSWRALSPWNGNPKNHVTTIRLDIDPPIISFQKSGSKVWINSLGKIWIGGLDHRSGSFVGLGLMFWVAIWQFSEMLDFV